jgi:hypothetical protein
MYKNLLKTGWCLMLVWLNTACAQKNFTTGIKGTVYFKEGNFMPSPDGMSKGSGTPVKRTLYVYEPTTDADVVSDESTFYTAIKTKKVKTLRSDANGRYAAALKPGKYSIFIQEKGKLYANGFDGDGHIQPVSIEAGKITELDLYISWAAFY